MVFTEEWTWTPVEGLWCRPRPLETEPLTGYAVGPGGIVGAMTCLGVFPADLLTAIEADDESWQRVPAGPDTSAPLIRVRVGEQDEFWLDRGLLADPRFEETARRIDDADRRARLAGQYPAVQYHDGARTEAARLRLAVPLQPDQVMEPFADDATAFPTVAWVPQTRWLTAVHYVGDDDMGAVFVLKHRPGSVAEVSRARRADPGTFARGRASSGASLDGELFIQRQDMGTGVEYHEAVHALSHWAMAHVLGRHFTEGVTEYFARLVTEPLARAGRLVPAGAHEPQLAGIRVLLDLGIGPGILAGAYFGGDLYPLFAAFAAAAGGRLSLQGYASRLGSRTARAAGQVLRAAAAGPPGCAAAAPSVDNDLRTRQGRPA